MARIRSIKPEFWTSGQVLECSTNARLMFIGLWNFADDEGRHPYRPKQIKAQIFPSDSMSEKDILGMLLELSKNGLITTYTIDNEQYLLINGWHHQRIDKPQPAKYPPPLQDDSGNILGTIPPDRIGEDRIGRDTIGKETKGARKERVVDKTTKSNRFEKPTLIEIRAYCESIKASINPVTFYNHYETVGWKVGKNTMKDWKAAIRGWNSRDAK